jgi:hypothetical protein
MEISLLNNLADYSNYQLLYAIIDRNLKFLVAATRYAGVALSISLQVRDGSSGLDSQTQERSLLRRTQTLVHLVQEAFLWGKIEQGLEPDHSLPSVAKRSRMTRQYLHSPTLHHAILLN